MKLKSLYQIILLLTVFSFSVPGQVNSAYTRFGLGDVEYTYSARRFGMGQAATSIADFDLLNIVNPAALYRLQLTRLQVDVKYGAVLLPGNDKDNFYGYTQFNGFSFGFPISTLYGISAIIGIVPVTNINYNIVEDVSSGISEDVDYSIAYEGNGGLSKMFIGGSYKLPFNLNVGAIFEYYFGNLNYNTFVRFDNTFNINSTYNKTYRPRGLGSTVGLLSPDLSEVFNSKDITDFRIGASVNYNSDFNTDTLLIASSSLIRDTLGSASVDMNIPLRISAGASFIFNTNYLFSVDYYYQPWSNYAFNGKESPFLRDASKISLGFEYKPEMEIGQSFWEQISWRAGSSFEQTQYIFREEGINQYSVSGGFSLPLGLQNSIDVGLEYAIRGTNASGLFKENIFRLKVGLSLGDLWFIRRAN